MLDALQMAFVFLVVCIVLFGLFIVVVAKSVRREIEQMIDETEDQSGKDELRLKLVKALYPPRFNRD